MRIGLCVNVFLSRSSFLLLLSAVLWDAAVILPVPWIVIFTVPQPNALTVLSAVAVAFVLSVSASQSLAVDVSVDVAAFLLR